MIRSRDSSVIIKFVKTIYRTNKATLNFSVNISKGSAFKTPPDPKWLLSSWRKSGVSQVKLLQHTATPLPAAFMSACLACWPYYCYKWHDHLRSRLAPKNVGITRQTHSYTHPLRGATVISTNQLVVLGRFLNINNPINPIRIVYVCLHKSLKNSG